jgi:hypothetical protein
VTDCGLGCCGPWPELSGSNGIGRRYGRRCLDFSRIRRPRRPGWEVAMCASHGSGCWGWPCSDRA